MLIKESILTCTSLHLHNKHSMFLSLLDPNRMRSYVNRLRDGGHIMQLLCELAKEKEDHLDVVNLNDVEGVRSLCNISESDAGIVVCNLAHKVVHHPKYKKHNGNLTAAQTEALKDISKLGMYDADGRWIGVQIHKKRSSNGASIHDPIVLSHPLLFGEYEQVKNLRFGPNGVQTTFNFIDKKTGSKSGRTAVRFNKKDIELGVCPLEVGEERKKNTKLLIAKVKKECREKKKDLPSTEDMTYILELRGHREYRGPNGKGPVTISAKPVGFVNLDAYGLDLPEFATDSSNPMALETMASSESEEDGKMPAEEFALMASANPSSYAEV